MTVDWTTIISISVAFGAAATGQVISHNFSQKREEEKYNKECFQNLYSPAIHKVLEYLYAENFKSILINGDEYEIEDAEEESKKYGFDSISIFDELTELLSNNIKYASQELIMLYEDINSNIKLNNKYEGYWLDDRILLSREILIEYTKLSKKLKSYSKKMKERLDSPLLFTQLYHLLHQCRCNDLADNLYFDLALLDTIVLPKNNFFERANEISNRIDYEFGEGYSKTKTVNSSVYNDAFEFLYEIVNEFAIIGVDRADVWIEELEKAQRLDSAIN